MNFMQQNSLAFAVFMTNSVTFRGLHLQVFQVSGWQPVQLLVCDWLIRLSKIVTKIACWPVCLVQVTLGDFKASVSVVAVLSNSFACPCHLHRTKT